MSKVWVWTLVSSLSLTDGEVMGVESKLVSSVGTSLSDGTEVALEDKVMLVSTDDSLLPDGMEEEDAVSPPPQEERSNADKTSAKNFFIGVFPFVFCFRYKISLSNVYQI